MKRKNTNRFLFIILLILIIITIAVIFILNSKEDNNEPSNDNQNINTVSDEVKYDNGEDSYYNYYKNGQVDINIGEYVKLPDNYLQYKLDSNTQEGINRLIYTIIEASTVNIPNTLLNGYYGDMYNSAKAGAELENKTLDEYIKEIYGYETYQKYAEDNTKYFEEDIKKDLVYQALANDFNIKITKSDVESYFSERLQNGDTYESLIDLYGEKLMYKYTIQDKVEKTLLEQLYK